MLWLFLLVLVLAGCKQEQTPSYNDFVMGMTRQELSKFFGEPLSKEVFAITYLGSQIPLALYNSALPPIATVETWTYASHRMTRVADRQFMQTGATYITFWDGADRSSGSGFDAQGRIREWAAKPDTTSTSNNYSE